MKRGWILWLLLIVFVWLVVAQFTEIEQLVETLSQGQWQWILFAVLLQILYYVIYTALYQSAFATVDVESRLRNLLPITFGSIFVNVVAPSGGASGAALFVDDAARARAISGPNGCGHGNCGHTDVSGAGFLDTHSPGVCFIEIC